MITQPNEVRLTLPHGDIYINLSDAEAADGAIKGGHPLFYVKKQPNATANYLGKLSSLFTSVPEHLNVFEYCGGIGLVPLACWGIMRPDSWITVEIDPSCYEAYQCINAKFILGDMYKEPIPANTDVVICDFPNNTLPKMWREKLRMELLRRIADFKPRYWEITDVGYYWIHLANHWPIYQEKFGVQVTRDNYHVLFDQFMRDTYGYKVIRWEVGGGAQYFLMEPV